MLLTPAEKDEFIGQLMMDKFYLQDDVAEALCEKGVCEDDLQEELLPEILREFVSEFDSSESPYEQIRRAAKEIADNYFNDLEARRDEAMEARWRYE